MHVQKGFVGPAWVKSDLLGGPLMLSLRASTDRGRGIEYLFPAVDLRALLVDMCRDDDMRRVVLESLIQADTENTERRRRAAQQISEGDDLLATWVASLSSDELFAVMQWHEILPEGSGRTLSGDYDADPAADYERALTKLPWGVGRKKVTELLARRAEAVQELTSDD